MFSKTIKDCLNAPMSEQLESRMKGFTTTIIALLLFCSVIKFLMTIIVVDGF